MNEHLKLAELILRMTPEQLTVYREVLGTVKVDSITPVVVKGRFVNNYDGTVTDTTSGLTWVQNPTSVCPERVNWRKAVEVCQNLNLGTHSDWRLPKITEFQSLLDCTRINPALPENHPFSDVKASYYWSGTANTGNTNSAWLANLNNSNVSSYDKTSTGCVWPVRG
jgi:hypothetical protein